MISAAPINGVDLLARVQDYVLDGVKVQCFTDSAGQRFAPGIQPVAGWRFGLADLPTIFAMKSALLTKRARSRDCFDLMWFCQHGKTLADIVASAQEADDSPDVPVIVEHKLLGLIPLDADDEGLDPVGVEVAPADIHRFFEELVRLREIEEAKVLLANAREESDSRKDRSAKTWAFSRKAPPPASPRRTHASAGDWPSRAKRQRVETGRRSVSGDCSVPEVQCAEAG